MMSLKSTSRSSSPSEECSVHWSEDRTWPWPGHHGPFNPMPRLKWRSAVQGRSPAVFEGSVNVSQQTTLCVSCMMELFVIPQDQKGTPPSLRGMDQALLSLLPPTQLPTIPGPPPVSAGPAGLPRLRQARESAGVERPVSAAGRPAERGPAEPTCGAHGPNWIRTAFVGDCCRELNWHKHTKLK